MHACGAASVRLAAQPAYAEALLAAANSRHKVCESRTIGRHVSHATRKAAGRVSGANQLPGADNCSKLVRLLRHCRGIIARTGTEDRLELIAGLAVMKAGQLEGVVREASCAREAGE